MSETIFNVQSYAFLELPFFQTIFHTQTELLDCCGCLTPLVKTWEKRNHYIWFELWFWNVISVSFLTAFKRKEMNIKPVKWALRTLFQWRWRDTAADIAEERRQKCSTLIYSSKFSKKRFLHVNFIAFSAFWGWNERRTKTFSFHPLEHLRRFIKIVVYKTELWWKFIVK